jgi:5-methylcytosine-specific restriction protein A
LPTLKNIIKPNHRRDTVNKAAYQKVYNTRRWKRLRRLKLQNNPICEKCWERGRVTPTEEIHHIVPFAQDMELAYDYDNLIALCIECHKEMHKHIRDGIEYR